MGMKERRIPKNNALRRLIIAGRLLEQELANVMEKYESEGLTEDVERIQLLMNAWNRSLERFRSSQNVVSFCPAVRRR